MFSLEDLCEFQQMTQGSLYGFMTGVGMSFHKLGSLVDTHSLSYRFGDEEFGRGVM